VIGMAGMGLSENLEKVTPNWLEFVELDYGYSTIFANSTHFHFQFFNNVYGLKDQFWLKSPHSS